MFKNTKLTSTQQNEKLLISLTVLIFMFLFLVAVGGGFRAGFRSGLSHAKTVNQGPAIEDYAPIKLEAISVSGSTIQARGLSDGKTYQVNVADDAYIEAYRKVGSDWQYQKISTSDIKAGDSIEVFRSKGTNMESGKIVTQQIKVN